jgi:hypothetical protein
MTLPRFLVIFSIVLFSVIGLISLFKNKPTEMVGPIFPTIPMEIELDQEPPTIIPAPVSTEPKALISKPLVLSEPTAGPKEVKPALELDSVEADHIEEFFRLNGTKLPIVETITYKSRVPWQKGRPAWLSDYALHYQTSRHFIARSLNGKADYLTQEIKEGDRFNVLRKDKPFQFYLVVDTSRCKLKFYYIDLDSKQEVLLKTYNVGLGRLDSSKASGLLTPLGKYILGSRIATYKPKLMGTYQGKKTEMVTVFGTRWIPFEKEIGVCTLPAKGFGIHGTPWKAQTNGEMHDTKNGIGKYESDGCIRLATDDIEELFAIIVTKPTTIEIVRNFSEATFLK